MLPSLSLLKVHEVDDLDAQMPCSLLNLTNIDAEVGKEAPELIAVSLQGAIASAKQSAAKNLMVQLAALERAQFVVQWSIAVQSYLGFRTGTETMEAIHWGVGYFDANRNNTGDLILNYPPPPLGMVHAYQFHLTSKKTREAAFKYFDKKGGQIDPLTLTSLFNGFDMNNAAISSAWNLAIYTVVNDVNVPALCPDSWKTAGPESIVQISPTSCNNRTNGQDEENNLEFVFKASLLISLAFQRKDNPSGNFPADYMHPTHNMNNPTLRIIPVFNQQNGKQVEEMTTILNQFLWECSKTPVANGSPSVYLYNMEADRAKPDALPNEAPNAQSRHYNPFPDQRILYT